MRVLDIATTKKLKLCSWRIDVIEKRLYKYLVNQSI